MKKLNLAIIGQGRSGKLIHGVYYVSERNQYYNVKYVVDRDENRRKVASEMYEGCETLCDYQELFDKKDIDLVVNAATSEYHYSITKDLLEHKFNVLVEKPFARSRYECDVLIETAKRNGVLLSVFQQTFFAPFYLEAMALAESGKLGKIEQVSIRYNGFARRWDWQTLQKKVAGGIYNTGPHPIGIGMAFLGFDQNIRVEYSKLAVTEKCSGDSDDFAKIILSAPGKPVVDIEISATDAYVDYNLKLHGHKGTFKCTPNAYKMKYLIDGENPKKDLVEGSMSNDLGNPCYCSEKLVAHEEEGKYIGTAFDIGTAGIYEDIYFAITEGKKLTITPEMVAQLIGIIEEVHARNPLPLKYL